MLLAGCGDDGNGGGATDADVDAAFDEAVQLHEAGEFEQAAEAYDRVIALDAEHQGAFINRGHVRLALALSDGAIADFTRAIELIEDDADAWLARGQAYFAAGQYPEALEDFRQSIELDPLSPAAYEARADVWAELGEVDAALADYNNAVRLTPDDPQLYVARRMVLLAADRAADAEVDTLLGELTRTLIDDPADTDARFRRGLAFFLTDEPELALTDLEVVIAEQPDNAAAHTALGHVMMALGDDETALKAYDAGVSAAAEDDVDAAPAYAARAALYDSIGAVPFAVRDYGKAIELKTDDPEVPARLAWLLSTTRDDSLRDGQRAVTLAEQARDALLAAREADPNLAPAEGEPDEDLAAALDVLAAALADVGRFDDAVAAQARAIDLAPADLRDDMRERLAGYQQRKPHRE